MDGFTLAGALRRQPGLATLRLIAVSGLGRERDRARAVEAGFDAHLVKPFGLDVTAALLDHLGPALPDRHG